MTDSIIWQRLDRPGHEFGRLEHSGDRRMLSGVAVFSHQELPCRLSYIVICDLAWRTRSVGVEGEIGDREVLVTLDVDDDQRWRADGQDIPTVSGCIDVDLGFSPSTNLLPIRRLALAVGQEARVAAVWLPFPLLKPEVLHQTYRREGGRTYRYESGNGRFIRQLKVNEVGFVTDYPGLWRAEVNQ